MYTSAKSFLKGVHFYLKEGDLKIVTFMLHQSAERTYNTVILVFLGYKPKTHNLEKLHSYAKHFSVELAQVFPQNSAIEKHLFNLLKKGYVEVRYDKKFTISREEVQSLIERVDKLQAAVTEKICKQKINSLG